MADFDIKVIELSRVKESECYAKKIEYSEYWNAHGKHVKFSDKNIITFEQPKKFELFRVTRKFMFEYVPEQVYDFLELYADGVQCGATMGVTGEITCYKALKTKIKLDICIGSG